LNNLIPKHKNTNLGFKLFISYHKFKKLKAKICNKYRKYIARRNEPPESAIL